MSYRDMLLLRKEARGWRLQDMGDEPPENPPLDPEMMQGIPEGDPRVRFFSSVEVQQSKDQNQTPRVFL